MFCKPPNLFTSSLSTTSHNIYNSLVIALNASTAGSCIPVNAFKASTTPDVNVCNLLTFSVLMLFEISVNCFNSPTILTPLTLASLPILSTNFGNDVPASLKNSFILSASPSFT